jgi:D-3-phosphoglycerate dehydrogenase / 2-oxoglutarate reductase
LSLILVTAPKLGAAGVRRMEEAGARFLFLTGAKDSAEIESLMAVHPFDAVISRTLDLTAQAMQSCPTLKVITKHGVGVSNIDVEAATRLRIPVYVTPGANSQSVAELALALLLAAARRVAWMDRELRAGRWSRVQDGLQLSGRTLGLVGFGQIGQRLGRAALALGMTVVAYDPLYDPAKTGAHEIDGVALLPSLNDLLRQSHVVSLHVPLTATTRAMIGREQFGLMPPQGILINTARGRVVNEPDLIAALKSGHLYAAGLDTTHDEPIAPDSELLRMGNVVLTPHVGASTPDALDAVALAAANNVLGYLNGNRPDVGWCLNPQVLPA